MSTTRGTSHMEAGRINDRWPLRMTPDRVTFHADRPSWEAAHLDSMHHHLDAGAVVYDVGAECGDFTALYGSWGCEVVAVEPSPGYWPAIKAHWEANVEGRHLLAAIPGFAGAALEHDPLAYVGGSWPGAAKGKVVPDYGFRHLAQHTGTIPVVTVDHLASLVGPPTAVTIDVEGAEYRVLQGASQVLAEHQPLLWVSVHKDAPWMAAHYPGEGLAAIAAYLDGFGYRGELLADEHEAHWLFRT